MHRLLSLVCALFFCLFVTSPRLLAETDTGPFIIAGFEVEGLTRTRVSVIRPYYQHYIGRPLPAFSREKLIQDLRKLGIFYSVETAFLPPVNNEVVIKIIIEEKWTLVPIPIGGASGDSYYGGLLLFESNLFGLNKKFYGGGFLSTEGWKGMAGYIDPRIWGSRNSLYMGFSGGSETTETVNQDNELYQRYRKSRFDLSTEYGWRALDKVTMGFGFQFTENSIDDTYGKELDPASGGRFFGPTLSLRYEDFFYDKVLVHGISATARYERKFTADTSAEDYNESSSLIQYFYPVSSFGRAGLAVNMLFAPDSPAVMEAQIAGKFFKTLPDGVAADSALAAQASLELVPLDFGWGALTFVLFYEGGGFVHNGGEMVSTQGPGGGIRIYLAKIAVPAFGFDSAYSLDRKKLYFFVNVGMRL